MATGTFTSKDTYAGTLTDILSQNRYTYAENNPVTYADPSGHFSLKGAWNAAKAKVSSAVSAVKKAVTSVASTVKKTYNAVRMLARQELGNISRKITHGSMSTITASASRRISGAKPAFNSILSSESANDYVREQKNAAWMEGFSRYLSAGFGPDLSRTAGSIPGTTPWALSVASEIERKKCEAFDYCRNTVQELIKEKDITRIMNGIGLIDSSLGKAAGGAALAVLSIKTSVTGIGLMGIPTAAFLITSSYSDFMQGANEIRLGMQGNSLTPTVNGMSVTFYNGNDMAYHLSTNAAAMISTLGLALVQLKPNPAIAGETDDIAKKAAMQADDVVESTRVSPNINMDKIYGHVFSQDHINHGIMELGINKSEIINKFFNIAEATSGSWIEGANEIRTLINGVEVTIRIYVKDGEMINLDGFVGYSQRVLGNLISY